MNELEAQVSALLEAQCRRCLQMYNTIWDKDFDYEDLFMLALLVSEDIRTEAVLAELRMISIELHACSVLIGDETYEDHLSRKEQLVKLEARMSALENEICAIKRSGK